MELVGSAILIGVILSLVLIGPVFFMLLETSVSRGWRAAIVLDLGVITADVFCILIAYYGSKDLALAIQNNPSIYIFGGFFILIYGLVMFISKPNFKMRNLNLVNQNYFKTFMNGFLLNILNIGVIVFWFFIVSTIVIQYPRQEETLLFMSIVLGTFFIIDLGKIFLAQKVKDSFTIRRIFWFKKTIGFILMIFGVIVIMKGFGAFENIDQQIENRIQKGVTHEKEKTI
ncbi:LysE family translocator [Moheibacter lacus]|uniref:LysE family transporter n=1 Tax=Moheibacter lacus TaxID=2745851 RepID=A0A838ZH59_9FLAO|nr:LysE family transporter [Moheibacter lacus]MBA5629021.1 LysE family transporter [Moheibacter lacus]